MQSTIGLYTDDVYDVAFENSLYGCPCSGVYVQAMCMWLRLIDKVNNCLWHKRHKIVTHRPDRKSIFVCLELIETKHVKFRVSYATSLVCVCGSVNNRKKKNGIKSRKPNVGVFSWLVACECEKRNAQHINGGRKLFVHRPHAYAFDGQWTYAKFNTHSRSSVHRGPFCFAKRVVQWRR